MGKIILVTGGARSGKSKFAEEYAKKSGASVAYVATAEMLDGEMIERVRRHRERRPSSWRTIESPRDAHLAIAGAAGDFDFILFDCVTIYVTNILLDLEGKTDALYAAVGQKIDALIAAARKLRGACLFVTNEVGAGVVPTSKLARDFRDLAGFVNQKLGAVADEVYLVTCGIAVNIKNYNGAKGQSPCWSPKAESSLGVGGKPRQQTNKSIMIMGTSSHVGKSILCAALCRIFYQAGIDVAPFKAQNMALNSYVTADGGEMGRAQAVQAEAAGIAPEVAMNPVLLKPTGNACSQVILMGKVLGNMSAKEYHRGYSVEAFDTVKSALSELGRAHELLVIEGAGSPAEVNLKAGDIVNMRVAKHLNAPVLLVADIDRGGAIASLVGTLELLDDDERALVKGLVINKFRGDVTLLEPALTFLEEKTGKPVLGVIPHIDDLGIDDEDSVSLERREVAVSSETHADKIDIAVIQTPKISNFTDFDALAAEDDVFLRYVREAEDIGRPDLVILPGSKNTVEDLIFLQKIGLAEKIIELRQSGVPIVGICGGYQMLGEAIFDPERTESAEEKIGGLNLLPLTTVFAPPKITTQVEAGCRCLNFLDVGIAAENLTGYEIHTGRSCLRGQSPFVIVRRNGESCDEPEGLVSADGYVLGTYIHGLFDNDKFRRAVLNALCRRKNLPEKTATVNIRARKEQAYNRLAKIVRENLKMDKLERIIFG